MNKSKLVELQRKIEGWGDKVGLYDPIHGASVLTQKLKFFEEFGELCSGELKNKKDVIIDSIGDCFVVLVHLRMFNHKGVDFKINEGLMNEFSKDSIRENISLIPNHLYDNNYNIVANILVHLSSEITGDPFKCMEIAYNEIKDREGKMINGSFVKKSDL